jgi:hypothetical protein
MGETGRTVRRLRTIARARSSRALEDNLPPEAARIPIGSDGLGPV